MYLISYIDKTPRFNSTIKCCISYSKPLKLCRYFNIDLILATDMNKFISVPAITVVLTMVQ